MSTPAGWYPDPHDANQQRWWNGSGWSDAWQPRPGAPAPAAPAPPAATYGGPSGVPYGAVPYGDPGVITPAPTVPPAAVWALALGILGLVLCGFFTGIPAMIAARTAQREVDASGGRLGGRGLAIAGFWTGLLGTVWSGFIVLLIVLGTLA